jgi:8-oxo-dGTP pyrophosphatase MutT (NUDIX family)
MSDKLLPGSVAVPVPAATIMLIRDGNSGIEVFMVRRHHGIEFAAGALVFPGGKTSSEDFDPELWQLVDGASQWTPHMQAIGVAAIREAFEEAGVLLARDCDTEKIVTGTRLAELDSFREKIECGEIGLLELLRREGLRLACDELVQFAHWITPKAMPRRFDTHFFLAQSPIDHAGRHDGRESVDSVWVQPLEAIARRKEWNIMFPTKLNLMKLAGSRTVAEALAVARTAPLLTVEPWLEDGPDGKYFRIRDDAGYETTKIAVGEER